MTTPYDQLLHRVRECRLLESCGSVLGWDERTYMPRQGSKHRGDQVALIARLAHEMLTSKEIGDLLAQAEQSHAGNGDGIEAANLREIRREHDRAAKLPHELVEEIARVTSQAQQVWQQARHDNNFAAFRPWLERIVELKRREAQAVGYQDTPYDALLDPF